MVGEEKERRNLRREERRKCERGDGGEKKMREGTMKGVEMVCNGTKDVKESDDKARFPK